MRFLFAAILFLSAVAVFTLIAKVVYQGSVEAELERQSVAALRAAGFDGIEVAFDHHEVTLTGFVDQADEIETVRSIVLETAPVARLPEAELSEIVIRPTIPPSLTVESVAGEEGIQISGILGEDHESVMVLLLTRLGALGNRKVAPEVEHDDQRLLFTAAPEFAAASVELIRHSESARVSIAGGKFKLSGTVPNDGIKEGILELAAMVEADHLVDEISVLDPRSFLKKSTLILTRNRFGVILNGVLSSGDGGADVVGILNAASPSTVVNDRRRHSSDRVAGSWEAHAADVLPALIEHITGEMTIEFTEEQIRLTGLTASSESREKILAAIQPILNENSGIEVLADLQIDDPSVDEGPASSLLATFEEGFFTLKGRVPDDSFVSALEEGLVALNPDILVKNDLKVDEGVRPAEWIDQLKAFFVDAIPRVEAGTFEFTQSQVTLSGTTIAITDKAILQNMAVNSVPLGFTIENQLVHADDPFPMPELLPEARAELEVALKQYPIYFDTNSEIVNEKGREKIEAIADLLLKTGAPVDLVATGFADNVGNAEYNRELSLRRAASVVAALTLFEIPKERITTESKGEDVSGVSRSERWKARRVEISLAPSVEDEAP
ncbi:MAG: OmpA family protein [Verrucomicrobiales bacterium]|nr:OmpA family protein [Verrucomicrobiales bacterium]